MACCRAFEVDVVEDVEEVADIVLIELAFVRVSPRVIGIVKPKMSCPAFSAGQW